MVRCQLLLFPEWHLSEGSIVWMCSSVPSVGTRNWIHIFKITSQYKKNWMTPSMPWHRLCSTPTLIQLFPANCGCNNLNCNLLLILSLSLSFSLSLSLFLSFSFFFRNKNIFLSDGSETIYFHSQFISFFSSRANRLYIFVVYYKVLSVFGWCKSWHGKTWQAGDSRLQDTEGGGKIIRVTSSRNLPFFLFLNGMLEWPTFFRNRDGWGW